MRSLQEIALEIQKDWKNWEESYASGAILTMLQDKKDGEIVSHSGSQGVMDREQLILRFLSNSRGWRGIVARRVKAELKEMIRG